MKIIKTGLFVVFTHALLVMGGCATDTATPVPAEAAPSLSGSKWHYADEQWQYDLEFAANGVLLTTHPNDKTKDNDTWEQDGVNVNFYFNNKFSQYKGALSGNNLMSGTATNQKGSTWNWKATRAD
jgi:hypothetical protein